MTEMRLLFAGYCHPHFPGHVAVTATWSSYVFPAREPNNITSQSGECSSELLSGNTSHALRQEEN